MVTVSRDREMLIFGLYSSDVETRVYRGEEVEEHSAAVGPEG